MNQPLSLSGGNLSLRAERRTSLFGWAASGLVHGLALMAALSLFEGVRLSPQPPTFRWDVSLVQQTSDTQSVAAKPRTLSTPQSATSAAMVPLRTNAKPMPAHQIQQSRQSAHETVHAEPTIHRVVQERVERQQSVMPTSTPIRRAMTSERQATVQDDRRTEAVEPFTEPAQSLGQEPIQSVERKVVRTSQGRETAITQDSALTSRPIVSSATPAFTRQVVRTGEGPAQSERSLAVHGHAVARAVVSRTDGVSAQPSARSTGPDYGWLANTLWRRVQALKRYPAKAAADRLQGEVVLTALVRANGEIVEIRIAGSSGSSLLDEAAVEAVRNASPLALANPMAHAHVSIEVPIAYHVE
ncbi:MAG: energy transducer TonB [Nitrospira defluvii]|nr:energy transducer TonB [Nitrospira defluvii]